MIAFHVQLAAVSRGNYHLTLQWGEERGNLSPKISIVKVWRRFDFCFHLTFWCIVSLARKENFSAHKSKWCFMDGFVLFLFRIPLGSCRKLKRARQKCILIMHYWVTSYDIFGLYLILWWYQNLGRMLIKMLILTPLSPIILNLY